MAQLFKPWGAADLGKLACQGERQGLPATLGLLQRGRTIATAQYAAIDQSTSPTSFCTTGGRGVWTFREALPIPTVARSAMPGAIRLGPFVQRSDAIGGITIAT
jgi:hypothetical protein